MEDCSTAQEHSASINDVLPDSDPAKPNNAPVILFLHFKFYYPYQYFVLIFPTLLYRVAVLFYHLTIHPTISVFCTHLSNFTLPCCCFILPSYHSSHHLSILYSSFQLYFTVLLFYFTILPFIPPSQYFVLIFPTLLYRVAVLFYHLTIHPTISVFCTHLSNFTLPCCCFILPSYHSSHHLSILLL